MDIKEFIEECLKQIVNGADSASNDLYKFELDSDKGRGVHFDLAVINSESNSSKTGGKGGIAIKIVDASMNKENSKTHNSEVVSRIDFTINHRDLAKEKETARFFAQHNRSLENNNPFNAA